MTGLSILLTAAQRIFLELESVYAIFLLNSPVKPEWWYTPIRILALGKLKQEDHEFMTSLC
jgi:hypothetical protein